MIFVAGPARLGHIGAVYDRYAITQPDDAPFQFAPRARRLA